MAAAMDPGACKKTNDTVPALQCFENSFNFKAGPDYFAACAFLILFGVQILCNLSRWDRTRRMHAKFIQVHRKIQKPFFYFGLFPTKWLSGFDPQVEIIVEAYLGVLCAVLGFGAAAALVMSYQFLGGIVVALLFVAQIPFFAPLRRVSEQVGGHKICSMANYLFVTSAALLSPAYNIRSSNMLTLALQIMFASKYFGSAICKIKASIAARKLWGDGIGLQVRMLECSAINRPVLGISKFLVALRRFVLHRQWLLALMARKSLVFEAAAFVILLSHHNIQIFWSVFGIGFHAGIMIMMGIDFVSLWSMAYVAFLPTFLGYNTALLSVDNVVNLFAEMPVAALYLACQICASVLSEDRLKPFTCASVYSTVDEVQILRSEPINFWFKTVNRENVPFNHGNHMEEELALVPYNVLLFSLSPGKNGTSAYRTISNIEMNEKVKSSLDDLSMSLDLLALGGGSFLKAHVAISRVQAAVSASSLSALAKKYAKMGDQMLTNKQIDSIVGKCLVAKKAGGASVMDGGFEPSHHKWY